VLRPIRSRSALASQPNLFLEHKGTYLLRKGRRSLQERSGGQDQGLAGNTEYTHKIFC
jgi:hypothetical protein